MPALSAFIAFLAASLIAAAAAFYPAYLGVTALAEVPAHKVLTRLAMLFAAAGLALLLRRLNLANATSLGYGAPRPLFIRRLITGWAWGTVTMIIPFLLLIVLGVRELQPTAMAPSRILGALSSGLLAGLAVGFIEETFFRGTLYAGMRRHAELWQTALFSSLLFAALHFIRPEPFAPDDVIGWTSGFSLLLGSFSAYGSFEMWDSFAALVAVGVLLTLVRAWDGSIALAVGLHAGWVLIIKVGKTITREAPDSPLSFLTGNYDRVTGWLVAAWLMFLIAVFWRRMNSGRPDRRQSI